MKRKIACVQMDIAYGQPDENCRRASNEIRMAADLNPDIIILPELWTTGYDLKRLDLIADQNGAETEAFLCRHAAAFQTSIIGGSIARKTNEGIYNTMIIADKDGRIVKSYDKLHLFRLMQEDHYLKAGSGHGDFTLDGLACAGFICYDIRFPEWLRKHSAAGAEVLFVTAEWPKERIAHWKAMLVSRAIENQAYIAAVNRCGSDPEHEYGGCSMIISPAGEILAEAGGTEEILTVEIDTDLVRSIREQIPVLTDRRPGFY